MNYYKLYDEQQNFLGVVSSLHLRYYNPKNKLILCCDEDKAQYVRFEGKLYLVYWFNSEPEELKGKYAPALLDMATKEEYDNFVAEREKEKME